MTKRVDLSNMQTNYFDANVDNYHYNYIIENTILEELDNNVLNFVSEITNQE